MAIKTIQEILNPRSPLDDLLHPDPFKFLPKAMRDFNDSYWKQVRRTNDDNMRAFRSFHP